VVIGLISSGSQKASRKMALRKETIEMLLKRPKRSARYAGRIRPRIELPLDGDVRHGHRRE
jgi:hypothetical protein